MYYSLIKVYFFIVHLLVFISFVSSYCINYLVFSNIFTSSFLFFVIVLFLLCLFVFYIIQIIWLFIGLFFIFFSSITALFYFSFTYLLASTMWRKYSSQPKYTKRWKQSSASKKPLETLLLAIKMCTGFTTDH